MIVYALLTVPKINRFLDFAMFFINGFCFKIISQDIFHVRVRQRSQNLILHTVLNVSLNIRFMNKGVKNFQKLCVQEGSL